MTVELMNNAQAVGATDLADIIRALREMRQWSQDTLSALSRLSIRTVQRVENGEPSSGDTRRALALAFELKDADVFNKPLNLPSPEQVRAEAERLKRENVSLSALVARTGQELVRVIEGADMQSSWSAVPLEGVAAESFAGLVDYLRDYADCADCMTETDKLRTFEDVQGYLDGLHRAGFSVTYAQRDTKLVGQNWTDKTPWAVKIIYLVAFPTGSEPKIIFAPRKLGRLV